MGKGSKRKATVKTKRAPNVHATSGGRPTFSDIEANYKVSSRSQLKQ